MDILQLAKEGRLEECRTVTGSSLAEILNKAQKINMGQPKTSPKTKSKNCVCVVSVGRESILKLTKPYFQKYCDRHDIDLVVLESPKYALPITDEYNYNTFEKNQVYSLFTKYDRIARLDDDIIITDQCPNLFEVVPEDKIGVVFEDVGKRKRHRLMQIQLSKHTLGNLATEWNTDYFNSGVVICSKQHRQAFNINRYLLNITDMNLGPFKEQTLLNWTVRSLDFDIFPLEYKYNHMDMFSKATGFTDASMDSSYIIHYAGGVKTKAKLKRDIHKDIFNNSNHNQGLSC